MNDPIGQAIYDYHCFGRADDIQVQTNYTDDEVIPPSWFFRSTKEMPPLELKALELCNGKILDVGAAAGSHALHLQNTGMLVTAIEQSILSTNVMKMRGIQNVVCRDVFQFEEKGYDTVLILMNGTGIGGTISGLKKLFKHLKSILTDEGQILIDSSDIRYLFEEDDGSYWIELTNDTYFGEMNYQVTYKQLTSNFKWLFTDYDTLKNVANDVNLKCELVEEGSNYDFLARLSK